MTPDSLFAVSGPIALAGWLALAAGIVFDRPFLGDRVAGVAGAHAVPGARPERVPQRAHRGGEQHALRGGRGGLRLQR